MLRDPILLRQAAILAFSAIAIFDPTIGLAQIRTEANALVQGETTSTSDNPVNSPTFRESASTATEGGTATADVDLFAGSIRVLALSPALGRSSAGGYFREVITVQGPLASSASGSIVFHVSGSLTPSPSEVPVNPSGTTAYAQTNMSVSFNSFEFNGDTFFGSTNNYTLQFQTQGCSPAANGPTILCENGLSTNQNFELPFSVTSTSRAISISMNIAANSHDGGVADFRNTGFVTLKLPEGTTFTSTTGVFLSTPIPEPSTHASLVLGLLAVGAISLTRRYKRQAQ